MEQCPLLIPHSHLSGKGETQGGFFLTRSCARKAWGPLKTPLAPSEAVAFWFMNERMCLCGCRLRSPAPWAVLPLHGQRLPSL